MLEIKQIQPHQTEEVKHIILKIGEEIFEKTAETVQKYDPMLDIDRVQTDYFDRQGTFLVVMDDEAVVGCGGIKNLNSEICELKRMWLLKKLSRTRIGFSTRANAFRFCQTNRLQNNSFRCIRAK